MNSISGIRLKIIFLTALLFILSISHNSYAQENPRNALDLNFGISNFHIVDHLASPLIFRGTGIAPSLRFTQVRTKSIHMVEGSYLPNNLSAGAENFHTENYKGSFRYSYYRKAISGTLIQKQFEFSVGGSISSFFCMSDYFFDMPNVQARTLTSWYWSHSLDVALRFDYVLSDRNRIRFQAHMPVISNVSRPTYSSLGDYDLEKNDWKIKTFGDNMVFPKNSSISTNLFYQQKVKNNMYMQLNWEFYYLKYKDPATLKMFMNNFTLGAGLNF